MKRSAWKGSLPGTAAGAAAVLLAAFLAAGTEPEGPAAAALPEAPGQAGVETRRRPGGLADAGQRDARILRRRRPQEPGAAAAPQGLVKQTLAHGGIERVYFIHSPGTAPPSTLLPAVLILHGGGGAGAGEMAARTGMNGIADREGFLAVYPQGVDGQWNDGRGKTFRRTDDITGIDDVGFLSAVIDALVTDHRADPDRIYVMGLSNGGMMTHRLGIELGHRLAAIAPVIANLPVNLAGMKPAAPPPVLIMNGTSDPMMPWNGGPVRVLGQEYGEVLSTDETVSYWVRAAQLALSPTRRKLPDRVRTDRSTVEFETYSAPGRTGEVILYRIVGGGHQLPGSNTPDRPHLLGPKNMDIAAPEEIWAFFRRHSKKSTGAGGAAPSGQKRFALFLAELPLEILRSQALSVRAVSSAGTPSARPPDPAPPSLRRCA